MARPSDFHKGELLHEGERYAFDDEDFAFLSQRGDFHAAGDPSSSLCCATVTRARDKFGARLKRRQILLLSAGALGITLDALEKSLDWSANYMAWHDGGDPRACHVYPPDQP